MENIQIMKPIKNFNPGKLPPLNTYEAEESMDAVPVAYRLFTPRAGATWHITEGESVDEGQDILLFGLCDLGIGFPELGYVSLGEIMDLNANTTPVEVDLHWSGSLGKAMDEAGITWHRRKDD